MGLYLNIVMAVSGWGEYGSGHRESQGTAPATPSPSYDMPEPFSQARGAFPIHLVSFRKSQYKDFYMLNQTILLLPESSFKPPFNYLFSMQPTPD